MRTGKGGIAMSGRSGRSGTPRGVGCRTTGGPRADRSRGTGATTGPRAHDGAPPDRRTGTALVTGPLPHVLT
ncbi:hypothetical protein Kpho01_73940 [Kitasatospora phosalacinea]|uniref:Uncharacterized protein n=1 Tax=Kitasatospora phosalacinea TaxID=2065 RepID=A0A9W6USF0_9ACTN|nr:hypothetical protein Kpho01_73940 [Kitasatospora phosalacinea]